MTRVNLTRTGEILPLLAAVAFAGSLLGCESGGVGDPCIPEDEYNENFSGFKLSEENIESRSYQCESRICLVNHFQGRVSCPLGQEEPTTCTVDTECGPNEQCVQAGIVAPNCDPTACPAGAIPGQAGNCNYDGEGHNDSCGGQICNGGGFCQCTSNADCPATGSYLCQQIPRPDDPSQMTPYTVCVTRVCSKPQDWDQFEEYGFNPAEKLRCYVPGNNTPIATQVCGQCDPATNRDADHAVYCSCRCGPAVEPCNSDGDCDTEVGEVCEAAGDLPDASPPYQGKNCINPNYNFCDCPDQYSCIEVRKHVGLGDKQISGFYCVKDGTAWDESQESCTDAPYTYIEGSPCSTDTDCSHITTEQYCHPGAKQCAIRGVVCAN